MKKSILLLSAFLLCCSVLSAQWLPLAGGTITGSLAVNGNFTGNDAFLDKGFFNTVRLGSTATNQKLMVYDDGTDLSGFGQSTAEFRMYAPMTNHISFGNYNASSNTFNEKMRLLPSGRLGIGITNPSAALSLGPLVGHHKLLVYDDGAAGGSGFGQAESELRMFAPASGSNHISFGNYDLQTGVFAEHMRITRNGNIGIGTGLPDQKLSVAGTIRAQKVKVELANWPDFVFEPTYDLMPLSRLQEFILSRKHLPGIPSAKEVSTNGIDLGENQSALLQKIEELTLHVIRQEKLLVRHCL
ncbi:MAG: hypothetical protein J7527_02410, partial [Chitinophagaceae bacterium]|nr:hypothetical protein [Chitinophagaceae bacterium]